MANTKDPFFEIQSIVSEAWNEKKGLNYTSSVGGKKLIIKRLRKFVNEIKKLDFDAEINLLEELHKLK